MDVREVVVRRLGQLVQRGRFVVVVQPFVREQYERDRPWRVAVAEHGRAWFDGRLDELRQGRRCHIRGPLHPDTARLVHRSTPHLVQHVPRWRMADT